jgi:hypothetical protein
MELRYHRNVPQLFDGYLKNNLFKKVSLNELRKDNLTIIFCNKNNSIFVTKNDNVVLEVTSNVKRLTYL